MIFLLCIAKCNRSLAIDAIIYLCMAKKNPLAISGEGVLVRSLAVPYFRMGVHTIIGAGRFHFRGRDGIGWFPPAMAARRFCRRPRTSVRGRCGAFWPGRRLCVRVSARFARSGLPPLAASSLSYGFLSPGLPSPFPCRLPLPSNVCLVFVSKLFSS